MKSTDEQIRNNMAERLSRDARFDVSEISILVNGGVVTLTGSVPGYNAKLAAYDKAVEIRGVSHVDNQLRVEYPSLRSKVSDHEIEERLKKILSWSPDIDESKVNVRFHAGTVQLTGVVGSYWHLHKAEELVTNLERVLVVDNQLAVVPTQTVSDESIADNIRKEFERFSDLAAKNVLVEMADGVVSLTGTVKDREVERKIHETVGLIPGVVKIINNLNLEAV